MSNVTRILGIDPGNSGGMVLLVERNRGWYLDRCFKLGRGEEATVAFVKDCVTADTRVYMELVFGFAEGRSMKFGKYYGFVRGCVKMRSTDVVDVVPVKWMKAMDVPSKTKIGRKAHRQAMRSLAESLQSTVGVTDWNAAAILIALWGLRQEGGTLINE